MTNSKLGYYSWSRCEPITLCQLYLQKESVYDITALLGELGICQFRDLNQSLNAFQKKFVSEIRRCTELQRKFAFFEKELARDEVQIFKCSLEPEAPSMKEMAPLEQQLEHIENQLLANNQNLLQLKHRFLSLSEYGEILDKAAKFFEEAQSPETSKAQQMMRRMSVMDPKLLRRFSVQLAQTDIPLDPVVDLITLTGSIKTDRFANFERFLWVMSRGNILLRRMDMDQELEDPETGQLEQKCLFILVCQGERLYSMCKKICDSYHTTLYNYPEQKSERDKAVVSIKKEINDMKQIIEKTDEERKKILASIAMNLQKWKMTVMKYKSIHETMNLFSDGMIDQCLIAECWIPDRQLGQARLALQQGQTRSNSIAPSVLTPILTDEMPPTYNVTNKFTSGFQNIIDSYGTGSFGEMNPAPYSIITFPFIFAVMFGDTGHGIVMTLFALWLVFKEKQLKSVRNEIFEMFFGGRYIILLMGLFSIYTGAIYNDIYSKSVNLFGTAFDRNLDQVGCDLHNSTCQSPAMFTLKPKDNLDEEYRYPFGMDPVWQLSSNKVQYLNTYKMKLSVILGVLQMFFGVCLSLFNHCHFGEWISVAVEFIPQIIFLLAIFGYMNFMIIFKWFTYKDINSGCAPSILITLINMFMFKSYTDEDPCYLKDPMFEGQFTLQPILIILALICVPIMLFIKPIYLLLKNKPKKLINEDANSFEMRNNSKNDQNQQTTNNEDQQPDPVILEVDGSGAGDSAAVGGHSHGHGHGENGEFNFGDAFINQAIHTIEYCLGSVSHTASYLRLWALSLAHAQLSEVLWNMVMENGLTMPLQSGFIVGGVIMFFVFQVWAVLTVVILIVMEGLSAFLHALRLHWVEFMSKFYSGTGVPFQPFAFKTILREM